VVRKGLFISPFYKRKISSKEQNDLTPGGEGFSLEPILSGLLFWHLANVFPWGEKSLRPRGYALSEAVSPSYTILEDWEP
jgi:hypothetical protein